MKGVKLKDVERADHFAVAEELCRERWASRISEFRRRYRVNRAAPRSDDAPLKSGALAEELGSKVARLDEERSQARIQVEESRRAVEEIERRLGELTLRKSDLVDEKRTFDEEIKCSYEAFLSSKAYYKDRLRMRFSCDDGAIVVHFFTSVKSKSERNSVTLSKSEHGKYTLLKADPHLKIFDRLAERLESTGDLPGFICCARKCFLQHAIDEKNKRTS